MTYANKSWQKVGQVYETLETDARAHFDQAVRDMTAERKAFMASVQGLLGATESGLRAVATTVRDEQIRKDAVKFAHTLREAITTTVEEMGRGTGTRLSASRAPDRQPPTASPVTKTGQATKRVTTRSAPPARTHTTHKAAS